MKLLTEFIKHPLTVGTIIPSSKKLIEAMTKQELLDESKLIIELGTGTGIVTKRIHEKLNNGTKFISLEINKKLADVARKKLPRIQIHNDCATNIRKHTNGTKCDLIISGIPWVGFKEQKRRELMEHIHESITDGGYFITYTYLHTKLHPGNKRFKKILKKNFSEVKTSKIIWTNFPPAYVYYARK